MMQFFMKNSKKRPFTDFFYFNSKSTYVVFFFILNSIAFGQTKEAVNKDTLAKENKQLDALMQQLNAESLNENKTNYEFNVLTNKQNSSFNLLNEEIQKANTILKEGIDYKALPKNLNY
ncbi:hypothetical protein BXU11_17335 [Flavobacterium sp. LM5]|uniref:hypothetical protein n=1 Tax=Flavobacterium sp. LM5 TaxID=1938610 RepID=UPI000993911B|nr:hypothetical protein [Flavobacterium sp. LM5]OOV18085.1 hypothetical protein BXU11_17335 [Flavobacterium sp. LM5]